ncbi:hypothetical protein ROZALSC1DRAFT_26598 [Rozella allomycis CSF55]|uniref:Zinc finger, C2H2 domain-containing protein n=1 Tax=Rozella allomycis (strain CSF55) TaxID=988480 RepID=A0A075APJ3_ROZAC|nr:Zinc finger, C2H2 domain-containing protein [Rozella allomycis CSF55]RKP22013.1 hypothetical protein ROZALSC1DRAFT_26598 [Rozella allomycis CSF55]|eukprot:EPZ31983.1 Zinc finger, C2H2 domain-containing protein [Rozella allomycis CSF55]
MSKGIIIRISLKDPKSITSETFLNDLKPRAARMRKTYADQGQEMSEDDTPRDNTDKIKEKIIKSKWIFPYFKPRKWEQRNVINSLEAVFDESRKVKSTNSNTHETTSMMAECPECGKIFADQSRLKRHYKIHDKTKLEEEKNSV